MQSGRSKRGKLFSVPPFPGVAIVSICNRLTARAYPIRKESRPVDFARDGSASIDRRRQGQQGNRGGTRHRHEDRRKTSRASHAEARHPRHRRAHPLRHQCGHHREQCPVDHCLGRVCKINFVAEARNTDRSFWMRWQSAAATALSGQTSRAWSISKRRRAPFGVQDFPY